MWISLVLDGIVAVLLGVTIFYCFHLDRRLRTLRSGKDELKQIVLGLTDATLRAQQSVAELKQSGQDVAEGLTERVVGARALRDELELMIEAGNNLANRLEASRPGARVGSGSNDIGAGPSIGLAVSNEQDWSRDTEEDTGTDNRVLNESALENELLKALRQAR